MGTTSDKPEWQRYLEDKYQLPFEAIPGVVYAICYTPAATVWSISNDYPAVADTHPVAGKLMYRSTRPLTHYVGWTQQRNPVRRVRDHQLDGVQYQHLISRRGLTPTDEHRIKREGRCTFCSEPLRASLDPAML